MKKDIFESSLDYHRAWPAGKLEVTPTKPLSTQRDLALAYSPGVAAACLAIENNPQEAMSLTTKANLVAVISNGTAVLGLGNIGPLAAKPVMEGKAVLFKKFAGINVFDLEINESDPDKLIDIIASLEPTFGAINLEDIKAPECFYIEEALKKRLNIPVFHDDQHGTAIIVGAALLNALKLVGKKIEEIKLVTSGAGAAALACLHLLMDLGLKKDNITVTDSQGVIFQGRSDLEDPAKLFFARSQKEETLEQALKRADVFLGLSKGNLMTPAMALSMADKPVIFALANPAPEILPEEALKVRPDGIVATGRSDYPNQVNNILCFPFMFRGALDVGATTINQSMKLACVRALAEMVFKETPAPVREIYSTEDLRFGPRYIIPKPFDPRLITHLPLAVAEAAMATGVARRPFADKETYVNFLSNLTA